jgi:hypothetical protein
MPFGATLFDIDGVIRCSRSVLADPGERWRRLNRVQRVLHSAAVHLAGANAPGMANSTPSGVSRAYCVVLPAT